ncbi:hypothetical protein HN587_02050 [Candidatus Woesearchaeota archaeon]|nr:hypothetical protein [Candidatus Woesearchaeota archaeon]
MVLPTATKELIYSHGGKAGVLIAMRRVLKDMPIPLFVSLRSGDSAEDIGVIPGKLNVARGSHPDDYVDFGNGVMIDVLPTIGNGDGLPIRDLDTFVEVAERIRQVGGDSDLKDFCRIHKQGNLDDRITIMFQKKIDWNYLGSCIRHPHYPETVVMNYLDARTGFIDPVLFSGKKPVISSWAKHGWEPEVIEWFEKAEKSGVLDSEYAHQMEFVVDKGGNVHVLQFRTFKKFESPRDYKIEPKSDVHVRFKQNLTLPLMHIFGMTKPEGIELTYGWALKGEVEESLLKDRFAEQNGDFCVKLIDNNGGIGLRTFPYTNNFSGLRALIIPREVPQYLGHKHYRLMHLADVSIIGDMHEILPFQQGDKVRVVCTGSEALVEKVDYK